MTEHLHQKGIVLADGSRTSIKLEPSTWRLIEALASKQGIKWQEWIRRAVAARPNTVNRTSVIREAVTDACLSIQAQAEYQYVEPDQQHPLANGFHCVDEAAFSETIKEPGVEITYSADCKGFILHLGYRDGVPAIFIENEMRGGLNPIFLIEKE